MAGIDERSRCSLCGKCRSGRARCAQHNRGFMEQICLRQKCAEVKHLLQKAPRAIGKAGSLTIEVNYYHHTSRPNEAGLNRTRICSSELHAESLPKNSGVLPVREGLSYVGVFTELCGNAGRHRLLL